MKRVRITGITVIRNAVQLGYPLEYAVESVLPLCDEYIISEGHSTDQTETLLSQLSKKHPRKIRVLRHPWMRGRSGEAIAEAQNHAINNAHGDWIVLCQADEIFHEHTLPLIREKMRRPGIDSILIRFVHLRPDILHQEKNPGYTEAIRVFRRQGALFRYVTIGDGYTARKAFRFERFVPSRPLGLLNSFIRERTDRIDEPAVFHVGYCIKARERIESHASLLYPDSTDYAEYARKAHTWDGSPDSFWEDVSAYEGPYPRLLVEWWNRVRDDSAQVP